MADKRKGRPSVWAKSLAKFLGGDDHCWYKLWLQSTHYVDKIPKTPEDQARMEGHMAKHEAIAKKRADALRAEGYTVKEEDDTSFKIVGKSADLTGKCDIVAINPDKNDAIVEDAKGGRARDADHWQVRLYMWALPRAWYRGPKLRGRIQYTDTSADVTPPTEKDLVKIGDGIKRATAGLAPATSPSKWECKFCDLATCTDRWTDPMEDEARQGDTGGLF